MGNKHDFLLLMDLLGGGGLMCDTNMVIVLQIDFIGGGNRLCDKTKNRAFAWIQYLAGGKGMDDKKIQ